MYCLVFGGECYAGASVGGSVDVVAADVAFSIAYPPGFCTGEVFEQHIFVCGQFAFSEDVAAVEVAVSFVFECGYGVHAVWLLKVLMV